MTIPRAKRIRNQKQVYLVTCEHGGSLIPKEYKSLFLNAKDVLSTHRGWDPGALECAELLSSKLAAKLFQSTTSRLLIDLNRSVGHPKLFSEWTNKYNAEYQQQIILQHYLPYRSSVEAEIRRLVQSKQQVIHLSIHSFTPELKGKIRKADIGILFDPSRQQESEFCSQLIKQLQKVFSQYRIYKNSPYKGTSDGFTTYLRTVFAAESYRGIEIEFNQKYPLGTKSNWKKLIEEFTDCFIEFKDRL